MNKSSILIFSLCFSFVICCGTPKLPIQQIGLINPLATDNFGFSLSSYGNQLAVSAPNRFTNGTVEIFERRSDGSYIIAQEIISPGVASFGYDVFMTSQFLFIGSPPSSSVYIYEMGPFGWEQNQIIYGILGDNFGFNIYSAGNYTIIGAPNAIDSNIGGQNGIAYIFFFSSVQGLWYPDFILRANGTNLGIPESFGVSVFLLNDSYAFVGAPEWLDPSGSGSLNAGTVFVIYYNKTIGEWVNLQSLISPNPGTAFRFGSSVASKENVLLVSETQGALLHLFLETNGFWHYTETIQGTQSGLYGSSVSYFNESLIAVGSGNYRQTNGNFDVNLYSFTQSNLTSSCINQLSSTNTLNTDYFGSSFQIYSPDQTSTNTIVAVGAYNSNTITNSTIKGGSLYIFCAYGSSCTNCSTQFDNCGICNGSSVCTLPQITTGAITTASTTGSTTGIPFTTGQFTTGQFTTGQFTTGQFTTGRDTTGQFTTGTTGEVTTAIPFTTSLLTTAFTFIHKRHNPSIVSTDTNMNASSWTIVAIFGLLMVFFGIWFVYLMIQNLYAPISVELPFQLEIKQGMDDEEYEYEYGYEDEEDEESLLLKRKIKTHTKT